MNIVDIILGSIIVFYLGFITGRSHSKKDNKDSHANMPIMRPEEPYEWLTDYDSLAKYVTTQYTREGIQVLRDISKNTLHIFINSDQVDEKYKQNGKVRVSYSDISKLTAYNDCTIILFINAQESYKSHKGSIESFISSEPSFTVSTEPHVKWIY